MLLFHNIYFVLNFIEQANHINMGLLWHKVCVFIVRNLDYLLHPKNQI